MSLKTKPLNEWGNVSDRVSVPCELRLTFKNIKNKRTANGMKVVLREWIKEEWDDLKIIRDYYFEINEVEK